MRVIADVLGADAPGEVLARACIEGAKSAGASLTLVASAEVFDALGAELLRETECVCCDEIVTMHDSPMSAVKGKKNSSMARALTLLKEDRGDFVLSAGNTGALVTGASVIVGRIRGVRSVAIGAVLPFDPPLLLLDSGANLNPTAENLLEYAHLGSLYMEALFQVKRPRVALINNGAEETKGPELYRSAYALMKTDGKLNFIGNLEGRDVPFGKCDVLVADGFAGNLTLKLSEGFGAYLRKTLKEMLLQSAKSRVAALLLKKQIRALKQKLDYTEYGGAPLLGLKKTVIKAHGASDAKAIGNAIRFAARYAASGFAETLPLRLEGSK